MNKKKKQANKKHQRTKARLKSLKDLSLKKKKKVIAKPKVVEDNNDVVDAKEAPAKKAPAKKAPAKKAPAKKKTVKKAVTKKK